jgi:glycosyltransferase involved in cell wall biosynthesis
MSFIEVVTRCYKRPAMLAANTASLQAQTCADWSQTLLVDNVGMGMAAAQAQLAEFAPTGDYVLILDDDDMLTDPRVLLGLQFTAQAAGNPPAIIMRVDHGPLGILPADVNWKMRPQGAGIGAPAIVTRRDVWMQHRAAFASARYESDFDFINSVWLEHGPHIAWFDKVGARVQRISRGEAEHA